MSHMPTPEPVTTGSRRYVPISLAHVTCSWSSWGSHFPPAPGFPNRNQELLERIKKKHSDIHKFPLPCRGQNNHHQRGKENTPLPALPDEWDRSTHFLLVRVLLSRSTLPSESGSSEAVSPPSSCHLVQTFVEM